MKYHWLPVTRYEQNCSMLWCEKTRKAAIIDPGGDLGDIHNLVALEELELEIILITHGHFDHAGGATALSAETGAPIAGPHKADSDMLARMGEHGPLYGHPTAQNCTPGRWLNDGDQIRFGDVTLDVLHCPGHTPGHVAYVDQASRNAFVGDILFRDGIGRWDRGGDLKQLIASIRLKLFPLGDDITFLPGHGETSTFGRERKSNPFVNDQEFEQRWRTLLSGGGLR